MAGPKFVNLVNDLVGLGLKIPSTADGHLHELRKLIFQLPDASKAEREASEQLSKVIAEREKDSKTIDTISVERDRFQTERDQLQAELDRTADENWRLRQETRHSEDQVKLVKEKGRTAGASAGRTNDLGERSKEGRGTYIRDCSTCARLICPTGVESLGRLSEDTGLVDRDRERDRGNRAADRRRSRFDERPRVPSDAPRGPAIPNTHSVDSYRPPPRTTTKHPAPDDENSQASKHIKRPTSQDVNALDGFQDLLKTRTPVCGACKKHARDSSCDGKAECGTCRGISNVVCSYRYCEDDRECVDATCTYVHSHQWDEERENQERMVRDRKGNYLSRKKTR